MPLGAFKAALMGTAGVSTGDVVLLSSQTISGAATASITSGFTSAYGEYIIQWIGLQPVTDGQWVLFQGSTDGGSNYNTTITSTCFAAQHKEDDSNTSLHYNTGQDAAQSTSYVYLNGSYGNGGDECGVMTMHLFNPSSTTYVKHWLCESQHYQGDDFSMHLHTAGYFNTTSAINALSWKFESGNIDVGTLKLWGVK